MLPGAPCVFVPFRPEQSPEMSQPPSCFFTAAMWCVPLDWCFRWCCMVSTLINLLQAWFALYLESFRALLPASWADLALVSGRVLIF